MHQHAGFSHLSAQPLPRRLLSGAARLPPRAAMEAWIAAEAARLEAAGAPAAATHRLGARQAAHHGWLAATAGLPRIAGWRDVALHVMWGAMAAGEWARRLAAWLAGWRGPRQRAGGAKDKGE